MREEILFKIAELIFWDMIDLKEHPIEKVECNEEFIRITTGGSPKYHCDIILTHSMLDPEKEIAKDQFYITYDHKENRWV